MIKDAVRDAGYDLPDFALPAGTDDGDASKDQGAMDDEMVDGGLFFSGLEDGEGDMALFEPLDLGLEDVLAALGDRQQVVGAAEPPAAAAGATAANTTTTTTTNTTEAAKEDGTDDDAGDASFLLSALRQMNLTAPEADRLRTRARSAAESAIRDAVGTCRVWLAWMCALLCARELINRLSRPLPYTHTNTTGGRGGLHGLQPRHAHQLLRGRPRRRPGPRHAPPALEPQRCRRPRRLARRPRAPRLAPR